MAEVGGGSASRTEPAAAAEDYSNRAEGVSAGASPYLWAGCFSKRAGEAGATIAPCDEHGDSPCTLINLPKQPGSYSQFLLVQTQTRSITPIQ